MKKPLVGTLSALVLLGAAASPVAAATRTADQAPRVEAADFAGIVALSNCSGSVIRMPDSQPTDPALVMSNGHCLEGGFLDPGEVLVDEPSSRTFTLLDAAGDDVATLQADKIAYATMTDTDVSIYELTTTYQDIADDYGIDPLTLSDQHPTAGNAIDVVSGYWKSVYSCSIDDFVYRIHEGGWIWKDSIRYTPECETIHGTSGSPVIDSASGEVVAINNTGNDDGESCTVNNPCEVDENGEVTVREGASYAEETYLIPACVGTGNKFDLSAEGCELPAPAGE